MVAINRALIGKAPGAIRRFGQIAGEFNRSSLGQIASGLAGTPFGAISTFAKGAERYAPGLANVAEKSLEAYDAAKQVYKSSKPAQVQGSASPADLQLPTPTPTSQTTMQILPQPQPQRGRRR